MSFLRWLCPHTPGTVEEISQGEDLSDANGKKDEQVDAGPEGHSPKVVFQEVAVPRLKSPQCRLGLTALLQFPVHRVHALLQRETKIKPKAASE